MSCQNSFSEAWIYCNAYMCVYVDSDTLYKNLKSLGNRLQATSHFTCGVGIVVSEAAHVYNNNTQGP
jgi:hypothetical protein